MSVDLDAYIRFLEKLSPDTLDKISTHVAPNIRFKDPFNDVEGIEEMKDQIRWVPTDHMLADAFTKSMPPDLLLRYLHDGKYSFKYDDDLKNTKRAEQKARSEARKATITKPETIGTTRIQKAGAKQQSVGLKVNCCMWSNVLSHLAHPTADVNWVS